MDLITEFNSNNRGLSTVAGYTLTLAITGILITSLIVGVTGFVESESEMTASNQLEIDGNTLKSEINTIHGIATNPSDSNQDITTTVNLPERTASGAYTITITNDQIQFETVDGDVTVKEPLPDANDKIDITSNGRIDGGPVEVIYDGGDTIEVRSDD